MVKLADEFLDAEQNRAKIIFEKLLLLDRIKVLNEKSTIH